MGIKGDKLTNASSEAAEAFLNKIDSIGQISSKKMFGGHGIFHADKMFGIVDSKGQIFIKYNGLIKEAFEEMDAVQHGRMPYISIPDEIFSKENELLDWVNKAIESSK